MGERGSDRAGIVLVVALLVFAGVAVAVTPPGHATGSAVLPSFPRITETLAGPRPTGGPPSGAYFDYILIILMENHAICTILQGGLDNCTTGAGPYETGLARNASLATGYVDCATGSLMNYLCLSGASTFGCTADALPHSNACTNVTWTSPNIIDTVLGANLSWKAYAENMPSDCYGGNSGKYAAKHFPFVYYQDIVSNASRVARCVPAGANDSSLLGDLNATSTTSNYMWLTPNLCNDMHDCNVTVGDAYLKGLVPQILNSTVFRTQRAALFLTFDEDSGTTGKPYLYTVWAGPAAKTGYLSSHPYGHFSLLSTIEANWKLPPLNANDTNAANMTSFLVSPPPPPPPPPPLVANFSFTPASPTAGQTVTFAANVSGGTPPYAEAWAFGDASTGSGNPVNHTYVAAGTYQVNLTVSDAASQNTTVTETVIVASPPPPPPPPLVASFTFAPVNPLTNETVTFNATASGGTPPYTFAWTFGDGSAGAGATASHAYAAPGTYTVNLTVTDFAAQNSTSQTSILVSAPPPPPGSPTARFTSSPAWPQANASVTFNASASSDPNAGATLQFRWDWTDDGTWDTAWSANSQETHAYPSSGRTTARLEVLDSFGMTDSTTQTVTVDSVPPVTTATLSGSLGTNGWYVSAVTITLSATDPLSGVASTLVSVDNGTWQPYSTPVTLTGDGSHSVSYRSTDNAGNAESVATTSFMIDTTPPTTSASFAGTVNGSVFVSPINVTLSSSDAGSGVAITRYQIDGGAWTNYTAPFLVDNLGTHQVAFGSVDLAGNAETTQAFEVINGTIAGVPGLASVANLQGTSGSGGWYTSGVTVTLTLVNGTTPPDRIAYRIDSGPWVVYAAPFAVQGDGIHDLDYNASNDAGIVEAAHHVAIRIDTAPPLTMAAPSGIVGNLGWYVSNVTVTLNASDATSGVAAIQYRVDGGSWQTYATAIALGEGVHSLEFYAMDYAGNAESPHTLGISVDTTPPAAWATPSGTPGKNGWYVSNVTVTVNASDATSGVGSINCRIDGGGWTTACGAVTLGNGRHEIDFYATDAAGLSSAIQSLAISVDTVPPTTVLAASGTPGNGTWYVSNVTITLTAVDATSGVASLAYSLDGGPWTAYTSPIVLADGVHVVEYEATDFAGLTEAMQSATFAVDTSPPASQARLDGSPGSGGWFVSNVTVTLTSSDATSGVRSVVYRMDGGLWQTYQGAFVLSDGRHALEFQAADNAGLVESIQSIRIDIDREPPATAASLSGVAGNATWYLSNVSVNLSAVDLTSGVAATTWSVDGGAWTLYTGAFLIEGGGPHSVRFGSVDAAGNREAVHSIALGIEDSAPTFSALTARNATGSSVVIQWAGMEDDSPIVGYQISVDSGAFVSVGMATEARLNLSTGMHTIRVRVLDAAGQEAVGALVIQVASQPGGGGGSPPPPVTPTSPAPPWYASATFLVILVIGSVLAGFAALIVRRTGRSRRPR